MRALLSSTPGAWLLASIGCLFVTAHAAAQSASVEAAQTSVKLAQAASVKAAATAEVGSKLEVRWTGPAAKGDFVAIDKAGAPDHTYGPYAYPSAGNPLVILYTADLAEAERRVVAAGGRIVERHEFPGGRRFHFGDPAGNVLAVWSKT